MKTARGLARTCCQLTTTFPLASLLLCWASIVRGCLKLLIPRFKLASKRRCSQRVLCLPASNEYRSDHFIVPAPTRTWKSWMFVSGKHRSMSPLHSFKTSIRRSQSPRQSRDFSFNDVSSSDSDERSMSTSDKHLSSSRPNTMAMPDSFRIQGACCPRRPNLDEILSNQSPPPWTLSAFMAYLSQNHCLETLEFTMDAKRYRQHYEKTSAKLPGGHIEADSEQSTHLIGLWQRLMQAYIQPNGIREVNLPSDVRDAILSQDTTHLPPHPDSLKTAVQKVHELMEDSVLVPFLNSLWPPSQPESNASSVEDLAITASMDDRGLFRSRTGRKQRRRGSPLSSSPPLSASSPHSLSGSPPVLPPMHPYAHQHRGSAPSAITQFARNLSTRHGQSIPHSDSTSPMPVPLSPLNLAPLPRGKSSNLTAAFAEHKSRSSGEVPPAMSTMNEDSFSIQSISGEPMTPPTTPPTMDQHSPLAQSLPHGRTGNPWKRMRYSFGWGKKEERF